MTKPKAENWALYALTRQGAALAASAASALAAEGGACLFLPERLKNNFPAAGKVESFTIRYFQSSREILAENFKLFKGHLFVGATGLVVRHIAPLLKSKKEDPAVVVLSQDGRWAISLLSGHLGGGNSLAIKAADILGAEAVITTATDLEKLPALEVLAREADLEIEDFSRLAALSRRLVEGEKIPLYDPDSFLWPYLDQWAGSFEALDEPGRAQGPHIRVTYRLESESHPEALVMRPKMLALGLGCHKGLEAEVMAAFVKESLFEAGLAEKSVAILATVEIRRDEAAMLELSLKMKRPLVIYTKAELEKIKTPNPSPTVLRRIGVPSVCEAAALLASGAGKLIVNKRKGRGCTFAAALIGQQGRNL